MSAVATRPTRMFALGGWVISTLSALGAVSLRIVDPAPVLPINFGFGDVALVGFALMAVTFASVGAMLMIRRSDNAVGWIMVIVGLSHSWAIFAVASTFSAAAMGTADGDRMSAIAGWLTVIFTMLGGYLWPLLPLVFPTGRGITPAWDRLVRGYLAFVILIIAILAIQPGHLHLFQAISNPFGVGPDLRPLLGVPFSTLVVNGSVLIVPAVAVSLFSRYRSADHVERQQLKWFLLASSVAIAGLFVAAVNAAVTDARVGEAGVATFGFAGALVPIAIGVAVMRYRLFEIDRIISRTISWGVTTGVIVSVFVALVIGLQAAIAPITKESTVAVAASTLVAFALFQPLRRRVQSAVDHRFNRGRYDAERIIGILAMSLRDGADLSEIEKGVVATSVGTFQPTGAALWVRPR